MPALQATAVFIIFVFTSGITLKGIGGLTLQKTVVSHGSRCTVLPGLASCATGRLFKQQAICNGFM